MPYILQNFQNKTLRPIDSSTFGDILIIVKSDLCFKMKKKDIQKLLQTCDKFIKLNKKIKKYE